MEPEKKRPRLDETPKEIAKKIFQSLTDPLIVYDFADYFYTGVIPKSYFCILEDDEEKEKEFFTFLKQYSEYVIEKGAQYIIKVNIENQWVTFQLTKGIVKSRNIVEKCSPCVKKYCNIYICACYGCKNKALFKSNVCKQHQ